MNIHIYPEQSQYELNHLQEWSIITSIEERPDPSLTHFGGCGGQVHPRCCDNTHNEEPEGAAAPSAGESHLCDVSQSADVSHSVEYMYW